jgi:hypothetical protein
MHAFCPVSWVVDVPPNQWIRDVAELECARPSRQRLTVKDVRWSEAWISHDNTEIHVHSRVFVRRPTPRILTRRHDGRTVSAARIETQRKDLVSEGT